MLSKLHSPDRILSEAITLRAEAYRRWRTAADAESPGPAKRLYEALAGIECDRYERLLKRFFHNRAAADDSRPAGVELELPLGSSRRAPLRAAAVAAEAERRTWAQRLRQTGSEAPERGLLTALIEDARRVRDLVR